MLIRKTVGIDLGTTNSVIALLDRTDSTLLTGIDDRGEATLPSVVGWHPRERRMVVGHAASALCENSESLPLSSVKRHMGLERRFALGPESLTPIEASAKILVALRDQLASVLADGRYRLDRAVIAMPAYFNHDQIAATRRAGEAAGFEVAELIQEPTAAALYYARMENHGEAVYLVYDLGGGTFDVSIIRRRPGDCEVLAVSGDPFLGGDDFDRALASHFLECGVFKSSDTRGGRPERSLSFSADQAHFDPATPAGAVHFARLVRIAAAMKIQLSDRDLAERLVPCLSHDNDAGTISAELRVDRSTFERLIKDKVDRTIDCCHEALARARQRAGIRLADIDYVILVGGSSRIPLVRRSVQAAFCNPALAEHVRCAEPLLHEPDLCVAYGAALRAAAHGTRYLFPPNRNSGCGFELHITSPAQTRELQSELSGIARRWSEDSAIPTAATSIAGDGFSVTVRQTTSGMVEEVFLDDQGAFAIEFELEPDTDNGFDLALCDGAGRKVAKLSATIRHRTGAPVIEPGILATQLIVKPLQIEVLDSSRRRVKQVVAPVGAPLPGIFRCTCRTRDNSGRIVVPLYEENRVVHQLVIDDADPELPVGTPVDIELAVDLKHTITVSARVQGGRAGERRETATIAAAPSAGPPTPAAVREALEQLNAALAKLTGHSRSRWRARAMHLDNDLQEALRYHDEPKLIVRMAELLDLVQQAESAADQVLEPPWPEFARLVRRCLDLAAEVANRTGRDREELFEHVHAQERYAEQAYSDINPLLYRECRENLHKYAGYLESLNRDLVPRPDVQPTLPPKEEARTALEQFRASLAAVWKGARRQARADLEQRLREVAGQAAGLSARVKSEPEQVLHAARRLATEIIKIEQALSGGRLPSGDDAGLLEGSR